MASAVGITVSALTMGAATPAAIILAGAAGGAAGALTGALLNGANIGQIAKSTFTGAVIGGFSAMLNGAAGDGTFVERLLKHTFSQGWLEGIQGGNVLHGMMMGAVSGAGGHYIDKYQSTLGKAGEIAASAVLGGTIDELGGGKFANGAITSAFSIMFNDMMHPKNGDEDIILPNVTESETFQLYQKDKPLELVFPEFSLLCGIKIVGTNLSKTAKTLLMSCSKMNKNHESVRYTEHGAKQAVIRGFTNNDVKMIIKYGNRIINSKAKYGTQYKYTLNHNSVVVDKKSNRVITVFNDQKNIPGKPDGYIFR